MNANQKKLVLIAGLTLAIIVAIAFDYTEKREKREWRIYSSRDYNFEIRYPNFYNEFKVTPPFSVNALQRLDADPYSGSAYPSLAIEVHPISNFYFVNPPGGVEYRYDAESNTWWENTGFSKEREAKPERIYGIGWTGYKFSIGDTGVVVRSIVIPHRAKNVILEVSLAEGPDEESASPVNIYDIVKTLRFTKGPLRWVRTENYRAYYDGEITVSGEYWGAGPGDVVDQDLVCFDVDAETKYLVPHTGWEKEVAWFCFSNSSAAKLILGINKQIEDCRYRGKAKVTVANYVEFIGEAATWDTAQLKKVISVETPSSVQCESH